VVEAGCPRDGEHAQVAGCHEGPADVRALAGGEDAERDVGRFADDPQLVGEDVVEAGAAGDAGDRRDVGGAGG
jgi:hypothetical protein